MCATAAAAAALTTAPATAAAAAALFDFGWFEAGLVFFDEVLAVPVMGGVAGDGGFDGFLDVAEEVDFVFCTEGDGEACGSGAPGAADAVDVGFWFVGEVVVHDEADVFYIDSAGGDVCGDEDGDGACFEFCEGFFALGLGFVAMDGFCLEACGGEGFCEFVGAVFGAAEDDGELGFVGLALGFEKLLEEVHFIAAVDKAEFLVDALGGGDFWGDGDAGGILEDALGEGDDVWGEGGGEEEGLAFFREEGDDAFYVPEEAHV